MRALINLMLHALYTSLVVNIFISKLRKCCWNDLRDLSFCASYPAQAQTLCCVNG